MDQHCLCCSQVYIQRRRQQQKKQTLSCSVKYMVCFMFSVKSETEKFVEEELCNISMPEMMGKEGRFQYTITEYALDCILEWHLTCRTPADTPLFLLLCYQCEDNRTHPGSCWAAVHPWCWPVVRHPEFIHLAKFPPTDPLLVLVSSLKHILKCNFSLQEDAGLSVIAKSCEQLCLCGGLCHWHLLLTLWLKRSKAVPTSMMFLSLSYDTGNINASAEGVNINTAVNLIRDHEGRLKINNITCDAKINRMRAKFSGTLGYGAVMVIFTHPEVSRMFSRLKVMIDKNMLWCKM